MVLTLDAGWWISALMAATRWAGILLFTPVLGFSSLPTRVRVALIGAMTVVTATVLGNDFDHSAMWSIGSLIVGIIRELILGGAMGFGVQCAFGAFAVGGRLLDYQMGFGIATLFDPATQAFNSLMGTFLSMLGAVLFLALDAHHVLIRGVITVFRIVPVGTAVDYRIAPLIAQFGLMLSVGFTLVAPAVAALMLMDVAIGVAARLMPQVNAYFVAVPAKVFVGLLVFVLSLRYLEPLIADLLRGISQRWQAVIWAH